MADWLARQAALALNPTRWSRKTYTTYVTTMDRWSSRLGIANHQLEDIIFTEEVNAARTWHMGGETLTPPSTGDTRRV